MKKLINFYSAHQSIFWNILLLSLFLIVVSLKINILAGVIGLVSIGMLMNSMYELGRKGALERENAIKVVHIIKKETEKVKVVEYNELDETTNIAEYQKDKRYIDWFRHVISSK